MVQSTKDAIVEAAILLFNEHGFNGTSIRDIAKKANVNVSNIAYYFENKRGLLEHCFTEYFEAYLHQIESGFNFTEEGALGRIKKITEKILQFQCENIHLTRLVLREISIDSQMIREIMSTYCVKERYFFKKAFEEGIRTKEFQSFSINYMIIQYKSLLAMPFLNTYYLAEVLQVFTNEAYFIKKYVKEVNVWLENVVCNHEQQKLALVST
ncbi:TetR/AcrR family transcriptional regulator [Robertmurraya yapensis]|uniref:TetR/AcrR family transcriptional regulator n=1 Tax=Bacillus yapensis TaxID=2492960 RepID=A0A3S0JV67_9BACI|nr:forespore capture DNA-binding protein RefZ [Bacillus yapensis]RTR29586.1 TetR/AcrR family transcriptional regulator [Bacillus yapensis]TKS94932.1 TetR family transcriptional regulator [Bacillus yapensis]